MQVTIKALRLVYCVRKGNEGSKMHFMSETLTSCVFTLGSCGKHENTSIIIC